jgi:DUF971 family protein
MELSPFESAQPVHLGWTDSGDVKIVWDDAHESVYAPSYLREKCPCATCQGTHGPPTTLVVRTSKGGLPILQGNGRKAPSTEVKSVVPVGKYAIRFTWGDGHDGGIYSWRYLRSICPTLETPATAN